MDAAAGSTRAGVQEHVDGCETCRARVDDIRAALTAAVEADVPEPSPLYWDAFRRQVSRRIDEDGRRSSRAWRVPALGALAAAVLVAAIASRPLLPRRGEPSGPADAATLPAWDPMPDAAEDGGLRLLGALGPSPEELRGSSECEAIADCLSGLSEEETRALAAALEQDLKTPAAASRRAL